MSHRTGAPDFATVDPVPGPRPSGATLLGRARELALLNGLVEEVARGTGRTLVIAGPRGVGRSTLLRETATRAAPSMVLLRAAGAADEAGLAFAGIQQLCMPVLDEAERLPDPQQDALMAAFGMRSGATPEPFLVGLGVLGILSGLAEQRSVLCLVDDAQWLDPESTGVLRFVSRRLGSLGVGLVVSTYDGSADGLADAADVLELDGLPTTDALALLRRCLAGPVDSRVEARIVTETRGNPAALVEFGRYAGPLDLAGGFGLPRSRTSTSREAVALAETLAGIHPEEQLLLTVAAADPTGDPELLRAAGRHLGIPSSLLESDAIAGLVDIGDTVTFPEPLARSVVYDAASPQARREAHDALARAMDNPADADWRAWHRSFAVVGRDAELAAALESAATMAQDRGGLPASAVFWERAALLSDSAGQRGRRALVAAELKHRAGDSEASLRLLASAEPSLTERELRERAQLLRARAAYVLNLDDEIPPPLRRAAARLGALDSRLARDSHIEALTVGPPILRVTTDRATPESVDISVSPPAVEALVKALAALDADGFVVGAPAVAAAVARYRAEALSQDDALRWDWLACRAAAYVWDLQGVDAISARMVQLPRDLGAMRALPLGLSYRMVPLVLRGDIAAAAALGAELRALAPTRLTLPLMAGELYVQAWRGREGEATPFIDRMVEQATSSDETTSVAAATMARAVLCNGLGRHDLAFTAARHGWELSQGMLFQNLCLPELVEAAVRCRQRTLAEEALRTLAERTTSAGGAWALGVELRSRAIVGDGDEVESLYRESVELLESSDLRTEHARSLLVFGEWLRRRRRRAEARTHLRAAHAMFVEMGMEAFAARAERELAAVTDSPRRRAVDLGVHLTARELEVARLASEGFSNPEIGTHLYLSARTVQYHLRKVFMKLDISSRAQLSGALEPVLAGRASPALSARSC